MKPCILALDLGTTAFKAAPADSSQVFGAPTVVRYPLDYANRSVTCPPERYRRALFKALRGAIRTANELSLTIEGIGICSQAQTFLALDAKSKTIAPAIVWTDDTAQEEAEEAARALPDFARTSGFMCPSPLQFLPKVMRLRRQNSGAKRFLLLNEWIVSLLTGAAYGDETNAGMGGFFDIECRMWSQAALDLAGITLDNLAHTAPAASHCALLTPEMARTLGLPLIPIFSCGNDQSVAAIGAGLERTGDILCNFGTALVVYALRETPVIPANDSQISGIDPSSHSGGGFLLGLESECGNVIDWLARLFYKRGGVPQMIADALRQDSDAESLPQITRIGGGSLDLTQLRVGTQPAQLARALLEFYAARFADILGGVREPDAKTGRLFVGGGLSQSDDWLNFLERRVGMTFVRTPTEHPSLVGIARIINHARASQHTID